MLDSEVNDAQAVGGEHTGALWWNEADTVAELAELAVRTQSLLASCLALNCFKVVDNSAGARVLPDSGAALTAERKRDTTP